jgi:hypothetical protein
VSYGDDLLGGLDADPWEREMLAEALAETDAEEAAGTAPYGGGGPWHDQFTAIGAQLDATHGLDAQRQAQDIEDALERRPSAEAKIARGLRRVESGTYLPPAELRPAPDAARDPLGRYSRACGPLDELDRCAARYHAADCHVVTEAGASNGSAGEARAWRDVLGRHTPYGGADASALGLAGPHPGDGLDTWADLLEPEPEPGAYAAAHERMLAGLRGEPGGPAAPQRSRLPDVHHLATAIGLRR